MEPQHLTDENATGGHSSPPPAGGATTKPLPPPARPRRTKVIVSVLVALGVTAAAVAYYLIYMAPYASTDDAFIDAHVTLVSSRVAGQVIEVPGVENRPVKKGDLLLAIDPRDYQAHVAQAQADLATARGTLAQAKAAVTVAETKAEQETASVAAAEALASQAAADLKRYQAVESRAISRSQLDQAEAQARSTAADLRAAHDRARVAQAQVALSQANVTTASGQVAQAQARLDAANLQLSYTKITAPISGQLTKRTVQVGNYVQPGQALLTIVPKGVWVIANYKETQLTRMRPGQSVEIHIDAYPSHDFQGKVDSLQDGTGARFSLLPPENAVGNFVKVVQRVPVKILFDQALPPDLDLAPGLSVETKVKLQ